MPEGVLAAWIYCMSVLCWFCNFNLAKKLLWGQQVASWPASWSTMWCTGSGVRELVVIGVEMIQLPLICDFWTSWGIPFGINAGTGFFRSISILPTLWSCPPNIFVPMHVSHLVCCDVRLEAVARRRGTSWSCKDGLLSVVDLLKLAVYFSSKIRDQIMISLVL